MWVHHHLIPTSRVRVVGVMCCCCIPSPHPVHHMQCCTCDVVLVFSCCGVVASTTTSTHHVLRVVGMLCWCGYSITSRVVLFSRCVVVAYHHLIPYITCYVLLVLWCYVLLLTPSLHPYITCYVLLVCWSGVVFLCCCVPHHPTTTSHYPISRVTCSWSVGLLWCCAVVGVYPHTPTPHPTLRVVLWCGVVCLYLSPLLVVGYGLHGVPPIRPFPYHARARV